MIDSTTELIMSNLIPQQVFDKYYEITDSLNNELGVNCTLYFIPAQIPCDNCENNPVTGKSTGIYKSGGPISFSGTFCPRCNGEGFYTTEESEVIKMRCYFDRNSWLKAGLNFIASDTSAITYGFIEDLPKIRKANSVILNSDQSAYNATRYSLLGEPVLHGFKKNKYFIATWRQQDV